MKLVAYPESLFSHSLCTNPFFSPFLFVPLLYQFFLSLSRDTQQETEVQSRRISLIDCPRSGNCKKTKPKKKKKERHPLLRIHHYILHPFYTPYKASTPIHTRQGTTGLQTASYLYHRPSPQKLPAPAPWSPPVKAPKPARHAQRPRPGAFPARTRTASAKGMDLGMSFLLVMVLLRAVGVCCAGPKSREVAWGQRI